MQRKLTSVTTLDNLRREARRWLKALREKEAEARDRFDRAYPKHTGMPVLRDVQYALAREHGFENWKELKSAVQQAALSQRMEAYEQAARDFVDACKGDAAALERLNRHYGRSFSFADLKAEIWRRDYAYRQRSSRVPENYFPIEEAQIIIAQDAGFGSWKKLMNALAAGAPPQGAPYALDTRDNRIGPRRRMSAVDWDELIGVMKERRIPALDANGLMTNEALARVAGLDFVTSLSLGGSRELTDDGLLHLARMPQLERLDLNEYPGGKLTDRGLEVLRHLPNLRKFEMTWQSGITDHGVANLRFCERLEEVNLMGSPTGDGAIEALQGKATLRRFSTGRFVTNGGIPMLHNFPLLKTRRRRRGAAADRWTVYQCRPRGPRRPRRCLRTGPVLARRSHHNGRVCSPGPPAQPADARLRWRAERRRSHDPYRGDAAPEAAANSGVRRDRRRVSGAGQVRDYRGDSGDAFAKNSEAAGLSRSRRCRRCGAWESGAGTSMTRRSQPCRSSRLCGS